MPRLPDVQSTRKKLDAATDVALQVLVPHKSLRQWLRDLFPNIRDAAIRWSEDDAGSMAASVSYYLALSLFPMVLLLFSGLGIFLKFTQMGQDAHQKLFDLVRQQASPAVEATFRQVVEQFENQSLVSGPTGLLAAILTAIGVFAQIDRGFDRVWRIKRDRAQTLQHSIANVIHHRMSAFLMLFSLGGMIAGLFVAGMVFSQVRATLTSTSIPYFMHIIRAIDYSFIIGVNSLLFAMIYKFLPKKRVMWRHALRGGLLTACVWELGRYVLGAFLIGMRYTSAYGAVGSFIALLLWCYYAMSILFFGAEYVQVLQRKDEEKVNSSADATSPLESVASQVTVDVQSTRAKQRPRPVALMSGTERR